MDELTGKIEKIIYHNEENQYTIASFLPDKTPCPITIKGTMLEFSQGETIQVKGCWVSDPKFGKQFDVKTFLPISPNTEDGIITYLSSGVIYGIGPALAKRIVDKFGLLTIDIIENAPKKLLNVSGIGEQKLNYIIESVHKTKDLRNLMIFLGGYEISSAWAVKIYKRYQDKAISIIKTNPYQLALDVSGIGFNIADTIAAKLGIEKDSSIRAKSAILYMLTQYALSCGHVYFPKERLFEALSTMLGISLDNAQIAIEELKSENKVKEKTLEFANEVIYLAHYFNAENQVANSLSEIARNKAVINLKIKFEELIFSLENKNKILFAQKQIDAIKASLENNILIITGGPGTGKTTITNAIIDIFAGLNYKIALAAPTGRAAKKISEITGREAKTIHRLLKYNPRTRGFDYNVESKLEYDLIIIDEVSMIDILLMDYLLSAVSKNTRLIFVGDSDQLPSVGPGNVLKDMMDSGKIKRVELNEIFRQEKGSGIIQNAHRINRGEMPILEKNASHDFFFIEKNDEGQILACIKDLLTNHIPNKLNFNTLKDVQLLTPMNKGVLGTENLNKELQAILNQNTQLPTKGRKRFLVNDKVMQIKNNYEKETFNGDIGQVTYIDEENQVLTVRYLEKDVNYNFNELDELTFAYAITIHKSQGSEYPVVIIPLHTQHFIMLRRNLLYTAISRGKEIVIIVGVKRALQIAVSNFRVEKRYTDLKNLIS